MSLEYSPRIITDGLVLCLDAFDIKSYPRTGTVWYDRSGNGNHGTLTNGPTFSSANGGSIAFDGVTNQYVQTPFNSLLSNVSIQIWFNAQMQTTDTGSGLRPIVMLGDFLTQAPLEISMIRSGLAEEGKLRFEIGNDNPEYRYLTSLRYDNQIWHNAVLIKNGTTMIVYINGNLIVQKVNDTDILYDTSIGLRIGGGTAATSRRFLGRVSSTQVYNRVLSAAEVSQNFNATRGRYGI